MIRTIYPQLTVNVSAISVESHVLPNHVLPNNAKLPNFLRTNRTH